jgi:hypothetical protein
MKRKEGDQWLPPERDAELVLALRSSCICFSSKSISFMLKFLNTITHRRQETPPIIRLVMSLAEKMSDLLIMYCSRPLDRVEHILFHTYMEVGKATSKNEVKAVRQESFSDTMDSKPV